MGKKKRVRLWASATHLFAKQITSITTYIEVQAKHVLECPCWTRVGMRWAPTPLMGTEDTLYSLFRNYSSSLWKRNRAAPEPEHHRWESQTTQAGKGLVVGVCDASGSEAGAWLSWGHSIGNSRHPSCCSLPRHALDIFYTAVPYFSFTQDLRCWHWTANLMPWTIKNHWSEAINFSRNQSLCRFLFFFFFFLL